MNTCRIGLLLTGWVWFAPGGCGGEPTDWEDSRPLLRKHCTVCHSAKNVKEIDVSGGLALDTLEALRKGSAQPVVAAKSAASLLVKLLETTDAKKRMPLDANPLPQETIAVIRRWIDSGMPEGKPTETQFGSRTTAGPEHSGVPRSARCSRVTRVVAVLDQGAGELPVPVPVIRNLRGSCWSIGLTSTFRPF